MSTQPQPKSSVESGLADLVNAPTVVEAFGEKYEIRQLSIGQAFQASAHIARMALIFESWGQIQALGTTSERIAAVMETISFSSESVIGLIAVAIDKPIEWVSKQNSMQALRVLATVIEKNLPLFSPENIAEVKEMFGGLVDRISQLGGNTLATSSDTDMAH